MKTKSEQIKIINQDHYHHQAIISLKNFESEIDRKQALIKIFDDYERICNVIASVDWIVSFCKWRY